MNELKPCPFCGSDRVIMKCTGFGSNMAVCIDCGVGTGNYVTEEYAAEVWNTRAERTCRMEYQTGKDNPKRGWWLCNQCGGLTDSVGGGWDGRRQRMRPPAYCARCGAKVVD